MSRVTNTSNEGRFCGRAVHGVSNLTSVEMREIETQRTKARPTPWPHLAARYAVNEMDLRGLFEPKQEALPPPPPVKPALSLKEARFRTLWLQGAPKSEITDLLGVSIGTIDAMRDRLALPKRKRGQKPNEWRAEEDAYILRHYITAGHTAEAVGKALGRTRTAIIGRAYRKGWTRKAMMGTAA